MVTVFALVSFALKESEVGLTESVLISLALCVTVMLTGGASPALTVIVALRELLVTV